MTQHQGFRTGKADLPNKPPPVERKATPGKRGKGKVTEAKGREPKASTTNPRKRSAS